jgi:sialidase-1
MPFVCQNGSGHPGDNGSCPSCYACVLKSEMPKKNENRTWNFTGIAQQYTRESQLVQTINTGAGASHVYLNGRNFSPAPGHRYFARSTSGANQFTEFGIDSSLVEPVTKAWTGVVCSIERVSTTPSRILFSGPANATVRSNLTLRLSYDEAQSWSVSRVLYSGLSAYSDIAVIGNGDNVGIVFENGDKTFADRISVAVVPLSWIENKTKK